MPTEYMVYALIYVLAIVVAAWIWSCGIEDSLQEFPEPDDAQPSGFDQK